MLHLSSSQCPAEAVVCDTCGLCPCIFLESLCIPASMIQVSNILPEGLGLAELAPPSDPLLMSTRSMRTGVSVSDCCAACAHDSEAPSRLTLVHNSGPSRRINRTFCANDAPCTACSSGVLLKVMTVLWKGGPATSATSSDNAMATYNSNK